MGLHLHNGSLAPAFKQATKHLLLGILEPGWALCSQPNSPYVSPAFSLGSAILEPVHGAGHDFASAACRFSLSHGSGGGAGFRPIV